MDAVRQARLDGHDEVLVDRLGQERQHGGDDPGEDDEDGMERGERRLAVRRLGACPHPVARATEIPGREVVDEAVDRPHGLEDVVIGDLPAGRLCQAGHSRQDPAIEGRPGVDGTAGRGGGADRARPAPRSTRPPRRPAGKSRVGHEERVDVPQEEQPAAGLVGRVPAEADVLLGPCRHVEPAHDVDAHPLGGLVEVDRVAGALVHRPAVLGEQRGIAEDRHERRLAAEHRSHRQHRVEAVAELAREALGDEVGRVPLRPVVRILAIVERGEGHDARVQPRVADVGDPRDRRAARRTGNRDRIDIRAVRGMALKGLPTGERSFLELLAATDDVERAARLAVVDRQRQAPVALLADHPVAHVDQPVELPLVAEAGDPADLVDDLHDLVAEAGIDLIFRELAPGPVIHRAHADEPLVDEPEDQRRLAAPAVRVAVDVRLEPVEAVLPLEVLDDGLADVTDVATGERPEAVDDDAALV